ncbi:hypothetical protein D4R52_00840 [bacterium]|nr:MAG: hypothetical protein D4R52_00840 [bacterium]
MLSDIEITIKSELSDKIVHKDGLFFLNGREQLVELRKARYKISFAHFRKARKYLKGLRFIPFLRCVAISGSQALLNSDAKSDIDLFIITDKNRIWLARMFVSLYFQVLGQRRHGGKIAARFCLNHYLALNALIEKDRNLYTAVEYASLVPALGISEFRNFLRQNHWITDYLASPVFEASNNFFNIEFSRLQTFFEKILDWSVAPLLDRLLGHYQKKRIRMQEHILVSDSELSFHPGSRGQTVLARFQGEIRRLQAP